MSSSFKKIKDEYLTKLSASSELDKFLSNSVDTNGSKTSTKKVMNSYWNSFDSLAENLSECKRLKDELEREIQDINELIDYYKDNPKELSEFEFSELKKMRIKNKIRLHELNEIININNDLNKHKDNETELKKIMHDINTFNPIETLYLEQITELKKHAEKMLQQILLNKRLNEINKNKTYNSPLNKTQKKTPHSFNTTELFHIKKKSYTKHVIPKKTIQKKTGHTYKKTKKPWKPTGKALKIRLG